MRMTGFGICLLTDLSSASDMFAEIQSFRIFLGSRFKSFGGSSGKSS